MNFTELLIYILFMLTFSSGYTAMFFVAVFVAWLIVRSLSMFFQNDPDQKTLLWKWLFYVLILFEVAAALFFHGIHIPDSYREDYVFSLYGLQGHILAVGITLLTYTYFIKRAGKNFFSTYFIIAFVIVSLITVPILSFELIAGIAERTGRFCDIPLLRTNKLTSCIRRKAISESNPSLCVQIGSNSCVTDIARNEKDLSFCDTYIIDDPKDNFWNKNECYLQALSVIHEAHYCLRGSKRDIVSCYESVAREGLPRHYLSITKETSRFLYTSPFKHASHYDFQFTFPRGWYVTPSDKTNFHAYNCEFKSCNEEITFRKYPAFNADFDFDKWLLAIRDPKTQEDLGVVALPNLIPEAHVARHKSYGNPGFTFVYVIYFPDSKIYAAIRTKTTNLEKSILPSLKVLH